MRIENFSAADATRFWLAVNRSAGCWIWENSYGSNGYGQFAFNGRPYAASRVAYVLFNGIIPDNLHVLHRCDSPPCVNPAHLFLGTHVDNMADMKAKGRCGPGPGVRALKGEARPNVKLTEAKVREIRKLRAEGLKERQIAEIMQTTRSNIASVLQGVSWKHVL